MSDHATMLRDGLIPHQGTQAHTEEKNLYPREQTPLLLTVSFCVYVYLCAGSLKRACKVQTVQARFSRGCFLGMRVVGIVWDFLFCFKIGSKLSD